MIFVTVGTQLPFDRLILAVNEWAGKNQVRDVVAQVGPSTVAAGNLTIKPFVAADEFAEFVRSASLIVAHAGMGSIITAMELGKPIVIMPRRASLGEHRNEHQLATAQQLSGRGIHVAQDAQALWALLDQRDTLTPPHAISSHANSELVARVQEFVLAGRKPG
jgi:UDP-N-acetylglucosamine transferase subunit ALG13